MHMTYTGAISVVLAVGAAGLTSPGTATAVVNETQEGSGRAGDHRRAGRSHPGR